MCFAIVWCRYFHNWTTSHRNRLHIVIDSVSWPNTTSQTTSFTFIEHSMPSPNRNEMISKNLLNLLTICITFAQHLEADQSQAHKCRYNMKCNYFGNNKNANVLRVTDTLYADNVPCRAREWRKRFFEQIGWITKEEPVDGRKSINVMPIKHKKLERASKQ